MVVALWKAVSDVPRKLQRVVVIVQRVADMNQSLHTFYNEAMKRLIYLLHVVIHSTTMRCSLAISCFD